MVILFANIKKRLPKLELLDSLFHFVTGGAQRLSFTWIISKILYPIGA